jgi:hypothetical protein
MRRHGKLNVKNRSGATTRARHLSQSATVTCTVEAQVAAEQVFMASSESRLEAYVIHQNFKFAGWFCTLIMMASTSWSADVGAAPIAGVSSDTITQAEVKAAFARFIAGQNAHDPSIVSDVLVYRWGPRRAAIHSTGQVGRRFRQDCERLAYFSDIYYAVPEWGKH